MIPNFKFCLTDPSLDDSYLPQKSEDLSVGFDLRASETVVIKPFETVKIPLGVKCFLPNDYWLDLRPRSSTMAKRNLHCLYGVIDESYEGPILLAATLVKPITIPLGSMNNVEYWMEQNSVTIEKGEKIAQLIPVSKQSMNPSLVSQEEFSRLCSERGAKRGAGGFGSTS